MVNEKLYSYENLEIVGDWSVENVIYAVTTDPSYLLRLELKPEDTLAICFHTQSGGGKVDILIDGLFYQTLDL